jgi:uncharacterized protein
MTDLAASAGSFAEPAATLMPPGRIATLDIVRGVAVMGILAMNIVAFAMPFAAYVNPSAYGTESTADLGSWIFSFILIDGKMRGLFSFLFGASMLLVIDRAEAAGASPAWVHYSRMVWLLVFGLIHYFFIWYGDILALYAPIGMLAFFFRRLNPTRLIVIGIILLVLQGLLYVGYSFALYSLQAAVAAPGADAETLRSWADVQQEIGRYTPQQLQDMMGLYRGGYLPIVQDRLGEWMSPVNSLWQAGGETLAYMLFGMAALKSGFLTGAWENRRYLKTVAIGFGIGIPVYAGIAWWLIDQDFSAPAVVTGWMAATVPVRPLMIVAIAASIILLTRNGGWLTQRIAAAGRAAFTNYLGTSILMTFLFYGYGASLFGHLTRIQLWLPVIGAWAIMLLWSKPWLDRYRYGPFEWLWRSLARGRFQPMRKGAAPSSASSG